MHNLTIRQIRSLFSIGDELPLQQLKARQLRVVQNSKNKPESYIGSSSIVFRVTDGKEDFALKCYITHLPGRWEYLKQVQDELKALDIPWIVPFEIFPDELMIPDNASNPKTASLLLMPWGGTERLLDRVTSYAKNNSKEGFGMLLKSLKTLADQQLNQKFSHGDVSPENILVTPKQELKLTDHDTFVFSDWTQTPYGQAGWSFPYQHPLRNPTHVDLHADEFAFLILAISLKGMEQEPALFSRYNSSNGLLFTVDDFRFPFDSPLIKELQHFQDPYLNRLVNLLLVHLHAKTTAIPGLLSYLDIDNANGDAQLAAQVDALQNRLNKQLFDRLSSVAPESVSEEMSVPNMYEPKEIEPEPQPINQEEKSQTIEPLLVAETNQPNPEPVFDIKDFLKNEEQNFPDEPNTDLHREVIDIPEPEIEYKKDITEQAQNSQWDMVLPVVVDSFSTKKEEVENVESAYANNTSVLSIKTNGFQEIKVEKVETDAAVADPVLYMKKRSKVRASVMLIMAAVFLLLIGLKYFYPDSGIIKPVEFTNDLVLNPITPVTAPKEIKTDISQEISVLESQQETSQEKEIIKPLLNEDLTSESASPEKKKIAVVNERKLRLKEPNREINVLKSSGSSSVSFRKIEY
jgi:serine/threonine protein kinase